MRRSTRIGMLAAVAATFALGGCVSPQLPLAADYGVALRQNIAAQIANPEARYIREESPAASGSRAAIAQERYVKGAVISPGAQNTTTISSGGAGGPPAAPPAGK